MSGLGFKVGQKIQIVNNPGNLPGVKIGDIFTIKEIVDNPYVYGLDVPEAKVSKAFHGLYWFTQQSIQAVPEEFLTFNQLLQALLDDKAIEVQFPGRDWCLLDTSQNFSIFHTSAKYRIALEKVVEKFFFVMRYPGQKTLFVTSQKYENKEAAEGPNSWCGPKVICQIPNEAL
jgi:hypothetical protein